MRLLFSQISASSPKNSVVKLVKHMFSWIKYMEIISLPAVLQDWVFCMRVFVCVCVHVFLRPWVEVWEIASLRVLDLLGYSPSTHEGRFLVVPATLPGRQEHLTVCDRSSMRFLLQHL